MSMSAKTLSFSSGMPARPLTRSVVAVQLGTTTPFERQVSRTKTSRLLFVSPGTKFVQSLINAMKRPSGDHARSSTPPGTEVKASGALPSARIRWI